MSIIEKAMQKLAEQGVASNSKKAATVTASRKKPILKKPALFDNSEPLNADFMRHLQTLGVLPDDEQMMRNHDEYRRIKRPLLANAFGKNALQIEKGNLILVTSALPGEGKTHTLLNLALSMARERDNTVLVLDADVAKADASRIFNVEDKPGLMDLLTNNHLQISDVLSATPIPNLRVISAGRHHEESTELLASEKMSEVMRELASRYTDRIILVDAPPLLVTPEPQVLATLVGQIVLVVEAVKTPKHIVTAAVAMLDTELPLNLVLNKGNRSLDIGYYGAYQYGYGGRGVEKAG